MRIFRQHFVLPLGLCLALSLQSPFAAGDTVNLHVLEDYHRALENIHQICGRFPTTDEGLLAINERPRTMVCPSGSHETWTYPELSGERTNIGKLKYDSDGSNYRISGASGFFVTNRSPRHSDGNHWGDPSLLVWLGIENSWRPVGITFSLLGLGLIFSRKRIARNMAKRRTMVEWLIFLFGILFLAQGTVLLLLAAGD